MSTAHPGSSPAGAGMVRAICSGRELCDGCSHGVYTAKIAKA